MRVALLLVALVAAAHATCLADKLGVYFSNSGTGSLSGVNPTTVQNLPSLPICASAYTKTADGFSTCCNVDGFNAIKTFGDNIAASIDQIIATGESLKNVFANIDTTKIPDQYKEAFNTFKSVFGDFLKNFFGNYGTCVRAYADYYEGVLCSLCRPDFFPTVANITDAGVLQFRFDLGTCTSIVNKCTPAVQDLYTFVTKLAAAYALLTPNLGSLVPGVTVPSTNVDLDFLAGIAGSTTAEKIRIWLCNQRMAGISQIDLVELSESVSAISQFTLPVKREAGMIRLREWAGKLAQRQVTPAGSQTNTYNESGYPAYSVGTNQNFIQTAAASSFVASAVLVAAGVAVMLF